jgi:hypothetical protein
MGTQIPKSESKASWTIKQKLVNPEAAQMKVSLGNGRSYGRYIDFADSIINKIDRGQPLHIATCNGRRPGSRIEFINGEYRLV